MQPFWVSSPVRLEACATRPGLGKSRMSLYDKEAVTHCPCPSCEVHQTLIEIAQGSSHCSSYCAVSVLCATHLMSHPVQGRHANAAANVNVQNSGSLMLVTFVSD